MPAKKALIKGNSKELKRNMSALLQNHPETAGMTGKLALHLNRGDVCKVKIEDKEI